VAAIVVDDLRKSYGPVTAVDGVSFEIAEGEVYALLGHNGAGKSTTVEILEGHRTATSGSVSVLGLDPHAAGRELRDRIGIVLQTSAVEAQLTVREALHFYGACYRRRRDTDDILELVGLAHKADARIGTLSGGQRRRLDLGLGIVGRTTVLLTTHYLDEAEHLADRVGVIAGGRMVAEGTPAELTSAAPDATIEFDVPDGVGADELMLPGEAVVDGRRVTIETQQPTAVLAALTAAAVRHGVELEGLSVRRPSLEDVFLGIGGEPGGDE
jgi:ABC-2 type transport system ATP-binding protein